MEQANATAGAPVHSMVTRRRCPECDGDNLEWGDSMRNTSGVVDGRLRMHDVACEFFLGCCDCSETVLVVAAGDVAAFLTAETYG
ncbi:hypothetical protein Mal33_50700 [Rosistilla oblonga]|uniref:Uncharacterized protein n=1 Tax=Rosistilla oblonga TaxID=2527990 RepID=A0A518J160_9BACT|nr:hypothetical protein Mal33_50700 [Rosistilla oblonga]